MYQAHWAGHGSHATTVSLLGTCLAFLLHGFAAKQACLVLCLSKPTFLSDH